MKRMSLMCGALLGTVTLVSACQKDSASQLDYAHFAERHLASSPFGLLEVLSHDDIEKPYQGISVCIQNGTEGLSDDELLVEVKLAYATWLAAADVSQQAWSKFTFATQAKCRLGDTAYQSVVIFPDADTMAGEVVQRVKQSLPKPQGGWATLGIGGPGASSYRWSRRGDLSIRLSRPAKVVMNPYIAWRSLASELAANVELLASRDTISRYSKDGYLLAALEDKGLDDLSLWQDLADAYAELLSGNSDWRDLIAFTVRLEENRVISGPTFDVTKHLSYDTLLHEVGHQFGMAHADQPSSRDVTGPSPVAEEDSGRWTTEEAVMAYGENYLYLTEDDQAGIVAAKDASRAAIDDIRFRYRERPAADGADHSLLTKK